MDFLTYLPKGHKNPIDREKLVQLTGLPDRKVRRLIEKLTRKGNIIVNLDEGYFQYADESDLPYVEAYYRREMDRGWSILNKCRVIRRFINAHKQENGSGCKQIDIFEYMRGHNA